MFFLPGAEWRFFDKLIFFPERETDAIRDHMGNSQVPSVRMLMASRRRVPLAVRFPFPFLLLVPLLP
jgi:hypothetical protein